MKTRLILPFTPPYNWAAQLPALARRATAGVEAVGPEYYRRTFALGGVHGAVEVRPASGHDHLVAIVDVADPAVLPSVEARLRQIFDLDCDVGAMMAHLGRDRYLAAAVAALPGLRVLGTWDPFELAVRTILGQQISVAAATTLAGRLAAAFGKPFAGADPAWADAGLRWIFPRPEVLAAADLSGLGITRSRASWIGSLAAAAAADPSVLQPATSLQATVERLCRLPGIGAWTAEYIAMRAFHEPDAFPASDLGLLRALEKIERPMDAKRILALAEAWRPWRAYAAIYLWTY
ncbi:MAG: DNA-3-methyladenine glycosylase 2 family protein [Herpetosiphonaceae bacterium]|nr:DNA-3-methyladenine glycosylase 2 family protein [Herpetosiphonaceae bacterium]